MAIMAAQKTGAKTETQEDMEALGVSAECAACGLALEGDDRRLMKTGFRRLDGHEEKEEDPMMAICFEVSQEAMNEAMMAMMSEMGQGGQGRGQQGGQQGGERGQQGGEQGGERGQQGGERGPPSSEEDMMEQMLMEVLPSLIPASAVCQSEDLMAIMAAQKTGAKPETQEDMEALGVSAECAACGLALEGDDRRLMKTRFRRLDGHEEKEEDPMMAICFEVSQEAMDEAMMAMMMEMGQGGQGGGQGFGRDERDRDDEKDDGPSPEEMEMMMRMISEDADCQA